MALPDRPVISATSLVLNKRIGGEDEDPDFAVVSDDVFTFLIGYTLRARLFT
jgi:hypothetical protein